MCQCLGDCTVPSGRQVCLLMWPQPPRDWPRRQRRPDHDDTVFLPGEAFHAGIYRRVCVRSLWVPPATAHGCLNRNPCGPLAHPSSPWEVPQRACLVIIYNNLMPSACVPLRRRYTVCEKFPSGPVTFWGRAFTVHAGSKMGRGGLENQVIFKDLCEATRT